jgi:hypothetical protein
VRPPEASNLAWSVTPGVELETSDHVGTIELPLPVRYEGTVSLESFIGGASPLLAQSLLRAYVVLDENGLATRSEAEARAAVPVAEARVDALGRFVLNVPASLNQR